MLRVYGIESARRTRDHRGLAEEFKISKWLISIEVKVHIGHGRHCKNAVIIKVIRIKKSVSFDAKTSACRQFEC